MPKVSICRHEPPKPGICEVLWVVVATQNDVQKCNSGEPFKGEAEADSNLLSSVSLLLTV